MKSKITLLVFCISLLSYAQQGINYKALVKDGSGNVVANQAIDVQFIILENVTNVYQETHSPTTDANGLIIVYIGEGTTSDDFSSIAWVTDDHFLNVQINTGSGFIDMGTTQFMAVPYALQAEKAANVTGLEALDEGNGIGYRIVGRDPENYDNIGEDAVDLSTSTILSSVNGASGYISTAIGNRTTASGGYSTAIGNSTTASGTYSTAIGNSTTASNNVSIAMGYQTIASGEISTAMGNGTIASGLLSTAMGYQTTASGIYSTAMGYNTIAQAYVSTVIGRYNVGGGNSVTPLTLDPLFEIGNGTSNANRSNALTVLKNGTIIAPTFDLNEIIDDKALITKEYADINLTASGLEAIDEGNGNGYRIVGSDSANFGNIGFNAVDFSSSTIPSSVYGAIGNRAVAMGFLTTASGNSSTVMGSNTKAESFASTVVGTYNAGGGNPTVWNSIDPLFEIGNGTNGNNRSNALTILKNGKIGVDKHAGINAKLDIDHASSQTSPQINIRETAGTYARLNISNTSSSEYWAIAGSLNGTTATDRINFYHSDAGDIMSILGNGNVLVNGSVVHSSDRRLKKDIETLPYGLNEILKLQPKAYHWKGKSNQLNKSLGLIAQDVQSVIKEIVHTGEDENKTLSVSYTELIPILIKAIQEQQDVIESQRKVIINETALNIKQNEALQLLLKRIEVIEANQSN
ncbi:tail fiber domain-containing protein [Psychroserpens sp. AS72]|uniref:tail fiber domain-containing protein n=1 Tax=Psychroserpens sp. AS72 TaxID=3135775 RepID=UPI0031824266